MIEKQLEYLLSNCTSEEMQQGKKWYSLAHSFCVQISKRYAVDLRIVASVTASLSVLKSWPMNQELVIDFFEGRPVGHMGLQVNKCLDLKIGYMQPMTNEEKDRFSMKVLAGRKTKSFYHNMVYPTSSPYVTVDSHMTFLIGGQNLTEKRYSLIEQAIKEKAFKVGLVPCQLQAMLWLTKKRLHGINVPSTFAQV